MYLIRVFDVKLNSTSNGGSFKGNMRQKMSTAIYLCEMGKNKMYSVEPIPPVL
jgi:hypothetical protein